MQLLVTHTGNTIEMALEHKRLGVHPEKTPQGQLGPAQLVKCQNRGPQEAKVYF